MAHVPYDEFGMFHENAAEYGISYDGPPMVRRESVEVGPGRQMSALVWGSEPAELVLLHGGAQNAHTWDSMALALRRPLLAVDLPGHGHSDGPAGATGNLDDLADDVAAVMRELAPEARGVVGMSLGGLTALALVDRHPELVPRIVLVDVTPGVNREKAAAIAAFVAGPASFADFDEILARTIEYNPTRSVASLRRGILHNALQQDDGTWVWRHARFREERPPDEAAWAVAFDRLWDTISNITVPLLLVRGMATGSVVDDADEAELLRRRPGARVVRVDGAGHSVQGDRPVELAAVVGEFVP